MAACLFAGLLPATAFTAPGQPLQPRRAIARPAVTQVDPTRHYTDRIRVKFKDDLPVRLRNGQITNLGNAALSEAVSLARGLTAEGATWQREHNLPEAKLDELRQTAQQNLGRGLADLNTSFILRLPKGRDPERVIALFNALPSVEVAQPLPLPVPLPTPPNLETNQGYLYPASAGVNARYLWTVPGGTGLGVQVIDIEYDWNLGHADLSATLIGPTPVSPFSGGADHGTAVLGEMGARNNGWGVTGIAFDSTFSVVAANTSDGYNPAGAITTALGHLNRGDVLVIEQQAQGPDPNSNLVPMEWVESVYDAILTAVNNGVIVCEAAGNGNQNLDDPKFNSGHAPFLPEHNSGAILVGAGCPPGYPDGDRSRQTFSDYGSRVDLQGWGSWVESTGYGDAYSAEGTNFFYTASFNGTSSATPIVAGACAALQGAYRAKYVNSALAPADLRDLLKLTGTPQLDGLHPATEHIGPRPDLAAALPLALPTWVDFKAADSGDGSFVHPFKDLSWGLNAVPAAGTINIFAGATNWTGTINQRVTIQAYGGPATLGR